MRKKFTDSIEYKMLKRLEEITSEVVLRSDFKDIAESRQISRGLNKLLKKGLLVKIGFGLYAKATISNFTGEPILAGFSDQVLRDALNRLNVRWTPGSAELAYNAGLSTQVPLNNVVRLKDRLRREIGWKNNKLIFEGKINAK